MHYGRYGAKNITSVMHYGRYGANFITSVMHYGRYARTRCALLRKIYALQRLETWPDGHVPC